LAVAVIRLSSRHALTRITHSPPLVRLNSRRSIPALAASLLVAIHATLVLAQLPAARLYGIFPPGARQGTQIELTVTSGADLEGADRLHFSHAGITASQKTQKVEGQEAPQPVANQFVVSVAADVPPGMYDVRASGPYGVSNPRVFVVSERNELLETEPNNDLSQASEVPLGSIVSARCDGALDVDYYRFTATAGQRILIGCEASALDSRLDGTLELYDSAGRLLDLSRDEVNRDPFLDHTIEADGQYVVKVYDFQYGGGPEHVYRLSISDAPHVDFVFPPSALPGAAQKFVVYGRNLPGGSPIDGAAVAGKSLEQLTVEIDVPDDPALVDRLEWLTEVTPSMAVLDGFHWRFHTDKGYANAVLIARATAPVVTEQEPNDTPAQFQVVSPPCELVGQFQSRGDVDGVTFDAAKGTVYWIEVFSQRHGLPTDAFALVQRVTNTDKGEQVTDLKELDDEKTATGGLSFNVSSADPVARFEAPEDGKYRITLRDLYNETRGDPRFIYRLAIRSERPDFRLVAFPEFPIEPQKAPNPWTLLLRKGGTTRLHCVAMRRDNFLGEIVLTAAGLPEGVACGPAVIVAGQTATDLVFTATENAPDAVAAIRVVGRAKTGDAEVAREARPATVTWPGAENVPATSRLARDLCLAVAGTAPYLVEAALPPIELPQSRQLHIPVKVTRRGDFKGPVALTGSLLPDKVQNEAINVAAEQSEATVHLFVQQDAPLGAYTFYLLASAPVPFTKKADGSDKQNVNVVDASTPVTLTIRPGPMVLAPSVPNNGALARGDTMEVPVKVNRRNNFAGAVTLDLILPPGIAGVTAEPVAVAAEADQGTLVIQAAADATEGNHPFVAIRATAQVDGQSLEVHQPIALNIQK